MNILCIPATMIQYNVNLFVGNRERYGMCRIRKLEAIFKISAFKGTFKSTCLKLKTTNMPELPHYTYIFPTY